MRVNSGADFQSVAMGGGLPGEVGTSTATTATTITTNSATSHASNDLVGQRVVVWDATNTHFVTGTITSNTSGTNTVLTHAGWVIPGTNVAATTPPNASVYCILDGAVPGKWIALSTNATAPAATDTTLTSELNAASGGLIRAKATYSHTLGATSYTLTNTFTANANDGASNVINKMGVFNTWAPVTGNLIFEDAVPSPPTLVSGDTIQITLTVNI
jgi:hypothetical protein